MAEIKDVKVWKSPAGYVALEAPYNPALPARAKALGGRWNKGARIWSFTSATHDQVVALAHEVYGHCTTDVSPDAPSMAVSEATALKRMSLETRIANATKRLIAAEEAGDDESVATLNAKISEYRKRLAALNATNAM